MIMVIAEVPRWKIPAAQPLVKDPVILARAVQQSANFFKEVLIKPPVPSVVPKDLVAGKQKKNKDVKKVTNMEQQMRLMDDMVMAFIQR